MRLEQLCEARSEGARVNCISCRDTTHAGRYFRETTYAHLNPKPDEVDWRCPHGIPWNGGEKPSPPTPEQEAARELARQNADAAMAQQKEKLALAGRAHWLLAHTTPHWTPATFQQWRDGIPSFGCNCKRDADEYIAAHPPPLDDDDAMFAYFVDFHNDVNLKLDRELFGLPAARAKYGR